MSFPPRPPMGMPPMGPGMMPQGYAFAPMGMMSMGMGMMPAGPMMPQPMSVVSSAGPSQSTNSVKPSKKLVPQEITKDDNKEEKPPVTTVFVGNISERAPDAMVRTMLQRCGNVLSWKRVQGASGKLQAFGFCEYEDPEATLRCIRLLNEWPIADKKLVVKVDAKTKTLLDDYRAKKSKKENGEKEKEKAPRRPDMEEGEEEPPPPLTENLDEFSQREDRVAKAGLDAIMREYSHELSKVPPQTEPKENKSREKKKEDKDMIKDTGLDDMGLEDDKKDIINREIKSFRDAHKDEEEPEPPEERENNYWSERMQNRDRIRRERRDKYREREQNYREQEKDERRNREKQIRRRERGRERSYDRSRSHTRSRSRSRERPGRKHSPERSRGVRPRDGSGERDWKDREKELEEEEEAYERRKLEKRLREKEAAYRERLKNWEGRENKKAREYKKEKDREIERKEEEVREGRRLKEFLEDYDDERDDPKYYKGSALSRRLKEREKEKDADDRDRQREREELEEIRRRLLEEGHPDLEGEMAKIEREREEHLKPKQIIIEPRVEPVNPEPVEKEIPEPVPVPVPPPVAAAAESPSEEKKPAKLPKMQNTLRPVEPMNGDSSSAASDEDSRLSFNTAPSLPDEGPTPVYGPAPKQEAASTRMGFGGIKLGGSESPNELSNKRKKFTVGDVFNQDDDESGEGAKKRKLIPLDYDDKQEKKPTTAEEKRQHIKKLIERIPTAKDELFSYQLDWSMVDKSLMDKRIKPWVNKKIVEYIGEEEPTLTDFICQKVMAQSSPQNILNDVAMVLDEEAEVFVVKMWRLLIYETEAKKAGLVK